MRTTLMLTSNEHSMMFRTTTNGNLCNILRSFVAFLPQESEENGHQNKYYETQYFAFTLQYKFQYSYITAASKLYTYRYIYIDIRSMKPYSGRKMKRIYINE